MTVTRWGILSTARINEKLLAGAALTDEAEVVAVASRDQSYADAYARDHGIGRAHGSYEALLADDDVDAVYISLPNGLHVEWSIRALEAGKHVLCEKPLSRRAVDVEAVFDTAEAVDRFCMEAFMWRHNPQTRKLTELIAGGTIGDLRLVRAAFSFPLADLGNVRMSRELDGGSLMDVGCYCVSGARLLGGEPVRVTAQQLTGSTGVDVRFVATLSFRGGVLAHLDSALDLPDRSELEAIGSDGSIRVDDPWHCLRPGLTIRRGDEVERVEIEPANSYMLELENLGRAIRGDTHPLLGREDAVGQARAIEALYRAADSGEAVEL